MAQNNGIYRKVRIAFDEKRLRAEQSADERRLRLYKECKGLKEIDEALSGTVNHVITEIKKGPVGIDERIAAIRHDNEQLQRSRASLLESYGYTASATDPEYECPKCMDRGFADGEMCSCFKRMLSEETLKASGLGKLVEAQSFDTFSLNYYTGTDREHAENNLNFCRAYAEDFDVNTSMNLTFLGGTGLGKTHLSTSIARVVVERGFDVVYETAQNVITAFENDKFGRSENQAARYTSCELLIIDDLGTEAPSQYNVPFLYSLINDRMNSGKKTIISTNLSPNEIRSKYGDRILSRLMGEYIPLVFSGKDIRMQKLNG